MPRGPSLFKKTAITRATRAVLAAGLGVARIDVHKDGGFAIIPGKPTETSVKVDQTNDACRLFSNIR
jgi:hypothetical protein